MKLFNKYKFSDKSQALGGLISTAQVIVFQRAFFSGGAAVLVPYFASGIVP